MATMTPGEPNTLETPLLFTRAWSEHDFDQVHRLNHQTFAVEIPQHPRQPGEVLVDPRLASSAVFVAKRGTTVVGMVAISEQRPFSLDDKLANLDALLKSTSSPALDDRPLTPYDRGLCEVRLLSVVPEERGRAVFAGLMATLFTYGRSRGLGVAVISATTRQLRLYRHFGFEAFGPLLGTQQASYQGMVVTWPQLGNASKRLANRNPGAHAEAYQRASPGSNKQADIHLLPGPVKVHPAVQRSLAKPALSHRGRRFTRLLSSTKKHLLQLTNANQVQVLPGSGTTANDVVAAQLATLRAPGLIITSGEFGTRLLGHADGASLKYQTLSAAHGNDLPYDLIETALAQQPTPGWLWATHCETSSGVLHDLPRLVAVCRRNNVRLAMDCISSLGSVPIDLRDVSWASGSSGKALASFCGLAIVFHRSPARPSSCPRALNLDAYERANGVAFTISSSLVEALHTALSRFAHGKEITHDQLPAETRSQHPVAERVRRNQAVALRLRTDLRARGFRIVAQDANASPAVTAVELPKTFSSTAVGDALFTSGVRISYQSRYLAQRNQIQFCLMAETPPDIDMLPELLATICADLR